MPGSIKETSNEAFRVGQFFNRLVANWALLLAWLLVALPTLVSLAGQVWSVEIGAHGPIVLAAGGWLLASRITAYSLSAEPLGWSVFGLGCIFAFPVYVFGRAYDFISLETLGLYAFSFMILLRIYGAKVLRDCLFPIAYLAFLVPPPGWIIDYATRPLQYLVSRTATYLLFMVGYPVSRQGVMIFVAQYRLLVEDACSGMNSIVGLMAIGIFYIYIMRREQPGYAWLLLAMIIPVAILANILRVLCLILVTYYYGDGAAQGFLHDTAGFALFGCALLLLAWLDALLHAGMPRLRRA